MKDKKKHINQKLLDDYPKPGIPPESAWVDMKGMLDKQLPASTNHAFKWVKAIKLLTAITLTGAGLVYYISSNSDTQRISAKDPVIANTPEVDQGKKRVASKGQVDAPEALLAVVSISKTTEISHLTDGQGIAVASPRSRVDSSKAPELGKDTGSNTSKKKRFERVAANERHLPESNLLVNTPDRTQHDKEASEIKSSNRRAADIQGLLASKSKTEITLNNINRAKHKTEGDEILEKETDEVRAELTGQVNGRMIANRQGSADGHKTSERVGLGSVYMLNARPFVTANNLKKKFPGITIHPKAILSSPKKKDIPVNSILKNIHAGLLWNVHAPFYGYGTYFKGTNGTTDFYKILLPGIWLGKTLNTGSEILLKLRAFNTYGGRRASFSVVDSLRRYRLPARDTIPARDSTVIYHHSMSLAKVGGFNVGLQYNQLITNRISIGVGVNLQWQKSALIRYSSIVSDSSKTISEMGSLGGLPQKSDSPKYLNSYFLTSNMEVLYSWKKLQFGAGVTIPVTSMVASPYRSTRPVSGQVTVRWLVR